MYFELQSKSLPFVSGNNPANKKTKQKLNNIILAVFLKIWYFLEESPRLKIKKALALKAFQKRH